MDEDEFFGNQYAKNKSPHRTYVGKAFNTKSVDGSISEKRYITKVFDIQDFQEYYKDQKNNKAAKIHRQGQRQEIVATVDTD